MTCTYNVSDLPERIASKIAEPDANGCWLWTASTNPKGYGKVWWNGRLPGAHRVVYEILKGEIPQGLQLDHKCKVTRCCNPSHLEPVTNCENSLRGAGAGPKNIAKTHCPRGHELSADNLVPAVWIKRGQRNCLICSRALSRAWHRANDKKRAPSLPKPTEVT